MQNSKWSLFSTIEERSICFLKLSVNFKKELKHITANKKIISSFQIYTISKFFQPPNSSLVFQKHKKMCYFWIDHFFPDKTSHLKFMSSLWKYITKELKYTINDMTYTVQVSVHHYNTDYEYSGT